MYFLSAEERRYLQRGLLPEARRQSVAEELRGWNWPLPPLKPIYAQPLGVFEVAGNYCPTNRDLFLRRVQRSPLVATPAMREGKLLHRVVADTLTEAKALVYQHGAACIPHVERLAAYTPQYVSALAIGPALQEQAQALRRFEARRSAERIAEVLSRYPSIGADALAMLALPVNVEVKLDGRYLGLAGSLAADAVTLPDLIVMDLKFGARHPFHALSAVGYALVLESLFETPVDLGCVVYAHVTNGRVSIERDFHVIGDELRQTFVEARDDKMGLVEHERDPGLPAECPSACPYLATCRPSGEGVRELPERTVGVNAAVA